MKSKLIVVLLVIAAAIGGFFAGHYFTARSWNSLFMDYAYLHESNDAQHMVRALTYLREDKPQDGMDVLEICLDSALLTYTPLVLRPEPEGPPTHVLRAIRIARDYRIAHPWTSQYTSPEVSNALQQVMALPK
jgi:hypothetical protein